QEGVEMAAFRGLSAASCMRVKKVLRMAFRIVHLSIGVMPPIADCRAACRDLADEVGVTGGKLAPATPDNRRCGCHPLDFGLADLQASVAVRICQSTSSREQNATRIA